MPTFKELGYDGFDELFVANGLLAPTGTSPAVIKALNREMVSMNTSGPIREKLVEASYEPGTLSPEAVRRHDRPRAQAVGRRRAGNRRAREGLINMSPKRMPQ